MGTACDLKVTSVLLTAGGRQASPQVCVIASRVNTAQMTGMKLLIKNFLAKKDKDVSAHFIHGESGRGLILSLVGGRWFHWWSGIGNETSSGFNLAVLHDFLMDIHNDKPRSAI